MFIWPSQYPGITIFILTMLKSNKKSDLPRKGLNLSMLIVLNGIGRALYVSRPVVAMFLENKEESFLNEEIHKESWVWLKILC